MEPNDDIVEVLHSTPNHVSTATTDPALIAILSAIQHYIAEHTILILDLISSQHHASVASQEAQRSASEEENSPASEEAQQSASEEIHAPASEEAQQSSNRDSDNPIRNSEDDVLSLFGDNDLVEESDRFLDLIDESLRPSDGFGTLISEKVAKIVNEKFQTDLGVDKRKEILEKYKTPAKSNNLFVPKVNEPIWAKLKGFNRQRNLHVAVLQDSLVRISSALSVTIDELLLLLDYSTQWHY